MRIVKAGMMTLVLACLAHAPARAELLFSSGNPDGRMAIGSRPGGGGKIEIEGADDFVLNQASQITNVSFTGLLSSGVDVSQIGNVRVEIYRVFPKDSADPPSGNVPTRVNSPSDIAFAERDVATANLTFTTTLLNNSFTAANSVLNGINKLPNQTTGGEGAVTGQEVRFDVTLTTPFNLPADHYFFVPQVEILNANGEFYWLSAPKPIVAPGTPFLPDLQAWIRNENLSPDWLRVGTDIVGGTSPPTFNMAFSLQGQVVPEPSSILMMGLGGTLLTGLGIRRRRSLTTG